MIVRLLASFSIAACFLAAPVQALEGDEAGTDYDFVTLYAPDGTPAPSKPQGTGETAAPYPDIPAGRPVPQDSGDRRLSWKERIPWWREQELDRGPLPPFDRESTFERSLESGRDYREAPPQYSGPGTAPKAPQGGYGGAGPELPDPVIAAVLWGGGGKNATIAVPPRGPVRTHEGVTLIGSSYPAADNDEFFAMVGKAIDMTASLPDDLKAVAGKVGKVIYDPPLPSRRAAGAATDIVGVYTITDIHRKGALVLYKDLRLSSPLQVALSLIGGGVYARRHERLIALLGQDGKAEQGGNAGREAKSRLTPVGEGDESRVAEAECVLQSVLLRAERAFSAGQKRIGARLRLMQQLECR